MNLGEYVQDYSLNYIIESYQVHFWQLRLSHEEFFSPGELCLVSALLSCSCLLLFSLATFNRKIIFSDNFISH